MAVKLFSYDMLQNTLGQEDGTEESTNLGNLQVAKAVLRSAISQELTQRQLECVQLYFYEGLTEAAIGKRLGVSKSTVCRHLQKAKRRLGRAVSYGEVGRKLGAGKNFV